MIFGVLNPEKTWHHPLVHLPTSPVYCSHCTLGSPKNSIVHAYFILFTLSQKKTNCCPFTHHTWKISPCEMQNFFIWQGNVEFHRSLLKFSPCCNKTLLPHGLVLDTRALAAAKLCCTNLIFVEPGAKINGQYYRDMLLMQRLLRRSAALLKTCLPSSKTMRQHIVLVTQSSFCSVRHRSSSVLASTR